MRADSLVLKPSVIACADMHGTIAVKNIVTSKITDKVLINAFIVFVDTQCGLLLVKIFDGFTILYNYNIITPYCQVIC